MSWQLIEKVKKQLAKEQGTVVKTPGSALPMVLAYPNTYNLGMSNLGFQTIYNRLNLRADVLCERVFLPDRRDLAEYERTKTALFSWENQIPLHMFAILGVAIGFELDYLNFLKILQLGKIPLRSTERDEGHPLVVAGGPAMTFNPEPLADFVDVFVIGEGEEVIGELADCYLQWRKTKMNRASLLRNLADIAGLYVPSLYEVGYSHTGDIRMFRAREGAPAVIKRRWVAELDDFPAYSYVTTPDAEFKEMFLVEIARGCGRHCRFCMAGYCYRKPRNRTLEQVLQIAGNGLRHCSRIGLVGAAVSDYPDIDQLCEALLALGARISVASLRADSLTDTLVASLADSGHKTITLAPEAGSEEMRRIINKGITQADLVQAVRMARSKGIPHVKLYLMVGFADEKDKDIEAIVQLALLLRGIMDEDDQPRGMMTLSINPFIPKPCTPFQWQPMATRQEIERKLDYISHSLKKIKNIEIIMESPKWSLVQGALARGDRRLGGVILEALRLGGGIGAWRKAFAGHGLTMESYNHRERLTTEILPWQHIDIGVDASYFVNEAEKAGRAEYTTPCPQDLCCRCGVCKGDV